MAIVRFHRGKLSPFLEAAASFLGARALGEAQNTQLQNQQDFARDQSYANAFQGAVQNVAGAYTKGLLTKYEADTELQKLIKAQELHQSGQADIENLRSQNRMAEVKYERTGTTADQDAEVAFAQSSGRQGAQIVSPPGDYGMSDAATGEPTFFPSPSSGPPQGVPMNPGGPALTPAPGEPGVFMTPAGQRLQRNTQGAGTELAKLISTRDAVQKSAKHSDAEKAEALRMLDTQIATASAGWMPAPPRQPGIKDLQQADQIGTVEVPGYGAMFIHPKDMSARPLESDGSALNTPGRNIQDDELRQQAEDRAFEYATRYDKYGNLIGRDEKGKWYKISDAPKDEEDDKGFQKRYFDTEKSLLTPTKTTASPSEVITKMKAIDEEKKKYQAEAKAVEKLKPQHDALIADASSLAELFAQDRLTPELAEEWKNKVKEVYGDIPVEKLPEDVQKMLNWLHLQVWPERQRSKASSIGMPVGFGFTPGGR